MMGEDPDYITMGFYCPECKDVEQFRFMGYYDEAVCTKCETIFKDTEEQE